MGVRAALVGVGNCASALVQGCRLYSEAGEPLPGLPNPIYCGFHVCEIEFVAAFDVNREKVGLDLWDALFVAPNNHPHYDIPDTPIGVTVSSGSILDGIGEVAAEKIDTAAEGASIADVLKQSRANVVVNFLPVGATVATQAYARAAIEAGCSFVNAIPVPLASTEEWRESFQAAGLALIGDDIKSQLGATILHRKLVELFRDRGVALDQTYQLNFGGNMDFFNMLERGRLADKRESKTSAVTDIADINPGDVHIGPSDFVPWLGDTKIAYIRLEGTSFGNQPVDIEVRLSVTDSANSAGVVIDAIRAAVACVEIGDIEAGWSISEWFMKAPPFGSSSDDDALKKATAFDELASETLRAKG